MTHSLKSNPAPNPKKDIQNKTVSLNVTSTEASSDVERTSTLNESMDDEDEAILVIDEAILVIDEPTKELPTRTPPGENKRKECENMHRSVAKRSSSYSKFLSSSLFVDD